MNPELKAKWIEALRSGEYVQGRHYLFEEHEKTHCCLGVLCRIIGVDEAGMTHNDIRWPDDLRALLEKNVSYELTHLNDSGRSFAEIAEYIEANL